MKSLIAKIILIFALSLLSAFYAVDVVRLADVNELLSSMVDISSALFAAVGIWVAYLYPEAISVLTSRENVTLLKGIDHTRKVEKLVVNMLVSASVLLTVLFFKVSYLLLHNVPLVVEYRYQLKSLAIFLIVMICLCQIYSLISLMLVNISFIDRLHSVKGERKANDDL